MNQGRRVELAAIAVSTAVVAAIAAIAEPLPPLEHVVESRTWTRGIEFVGLLLVAWMLLSAIGVIQAKIGLKLDGVTAERLLEERDSQADLVRALRRELSAIHTELDRLADRLEALSLELPAGPEERIDALEAVTEASPSPGGTSHGSESGEEQGA